MNVYSPTANTSKLGKIGNMFNLPVPGVQDIASVSGAVPGGMPCKFQLVMEFFCSFIYFYYIFLCVCIFPI